MLHITEQLPPSKQHLPSKKLAVQWYYMSYHRPGCTKLVESGKNLHDETLESLMVYFQALFAQKKADGLLEQAKLNRICNQAKQHLASNLSQRRETLSTIHA